VHDAVAAAHLVGPAVLPEQPAAGEREEDLLVGAVFVCGRGEVPRGHLDAPQAHRARADLAPQVTPHPLDVTERKLP
jgi:hypothetical protein